MTKQKRRILIIKITALILVMSSFCSCGIQSRNKPSQTDKTTTITEKAETYITTVTESITEVLTETTTKKEENKAAEILAQMTLEEKVYQMFIARPDDITKIEGITYAGEETKNALKAHPVGGLVYFSQNLIDENQIKEMISATKSYSSIPLFISVDEEGGTVSRLSGKGVQKFSSMGNITSENDAYNVGLTIGTQINTLGFNLDFAPVADINSNPNNPIIGKRAFGTSASQVSPLVSQCVRGFNKSGISCCLKHFPGHGDTETDSHIGAAVTGRTLDEMRQSEFLPFKAGINAGAEFVMVGHISTPSIDSRNIPATLSDIIVTTILRGELGFNGIIITDSMKMQAITDNYTSAQAAVLAVKAGVDMILIPDNLENAVNGILEAVRNGEISEERINQSVLRILTVKYNHI